MGNNPIRIYLPKKIISILYLNTQKNAFFDICAFTNYLSLVFVENRSDRIVIEEAGYGLCSLHENFIVRVLLDDVRQHTPQRIQVLNCIYIVNFY